MMEKLSQFLEKYIAPSLIAFGNMKYMRIMQNTVISTTAIAITGSLFILLINFPIPGWTDFVAPIAPAFSKVSGVTVSLLGLYISISAAYYTILHYQKIDKNEKAMPIPAIFISMATFIIMNPPFIHEIDQVSYLDTKYLGALGLFMALIFGIGSTEFYRWCIRKNITIRFPDSVPPMVSQSFMSFVPMSLWLIIITTLRHILNIDIPVLMQEVFKPLAFLGDNIVAAAVIPGLNRLVWTAGIHGGALIGSITDTFLRQMALVNVEAIQNGTAIPYIVTTEFFDKYVWVGVAPLAVLCIQSRSESMRILGKMALIPTLFQIGEPLVFGIPIVMNPFLMIPHVLGSATLGIIAYPLSSFKSSSLPLSIYTLDNPCSYKSVSCY